MNEKFKKINGQKKLQNQRRHMGKRMRKVVQSQRSQMGKRMQKVGQSPREKNVMWKRKDS
jgi:hypothetical protein